jgi:hypothetical protein
MLKNIKNLSGARELSKNEQLALQGGVPKCPPGYFWYSDYFSGYCKPIHRPDTPTELL